MNINVGTAVISYFSEISGTSSASNFQNKKLKYFLNKFIIINFLQYTIIIYSYIIIYINNHTFLYTVSYKMQS